MRWKTSFLVTIFVSSTGLFALVADRVPRREDQKQKESTHLVEGAVRTIYSRQEVTERGDVKQRYLVEIEINKVEKGKRLEPKDLVYARCFELKKSGDPGAIGGNLGGHRPIPARGDRVRVYLVSGRYELTGQTDRGYTVLYPNGFEVLKKASETAN